MRKVFLCSLCHKGILGGGLYLEPQALTFRTNKLTVNEKYRNLVLPLEEIEEIAWKCNNCGYIHYGAEAPEVCPMCDHPQAHFRKKDISYI